MMRITLEQIKPDPSSVFPATLETDRRCINLDGKDGGTIKETFCGFLGLISIWSHQKVRGKTSLFRPDMHRKNAAKGCGIPSVLNTSFPF